MLRAYLDIETDGLSAQTGRITLVGIALQADQDATALNPDGMRVVQLVGSDADGPNLADALIGADVIYTYNGRRFDLPFIRTATGIDLAERFEHRDLMYAWWKHGLYGGLKVVERRLGIVRNTEGVDGLEAVRLWHRFGHDGDLEALDLLCRYNAEDVCNLAVLRQKLRAC